MDREKGAIGIITNPICKAGLTPLTNLITIVNNFSDKTYLITGNDGGVSCDMDNGNLVVSSRYYSTRNNLVNKILNYVIIQLFTSVKILRHSKDVSTWIFFLDAHLLLLPVITAKLTMKKVIFVHAASIKKAAEAKKSVLLYLSLYSEMLANRFADRIVLYSNNIISEWDMGRHIQKVDVASEHLLNFDIFTVITEIQDRENLIGYIGRFSEEKGVLNYTKALPAVLNDQKDLRALIGGGGQLKEAIMASLQEEGLTTRVDLPGWISHDDLPKYLNQLRLLVLPSYTEGLPNIMLEAMACGTPVLVTPVGAIPDFIVDGENGFIMANNSPECIVANVVRALSSPDLEQIAENGRQFVEENFIFETVVENWKKVFQDPKPELI